MDIKFWWNKSPNFLKLINYFFDFLISIKNLFVKKYDSKLRVICVGNFTLGGSGKTPMVRFLRETLRSKGYKCAVLLRGYKGNLKGPIIVDSNIHLSSEVGDEALLHAKDGLTIVSKNRVKGCKYIENLDVDLILLDDGFQNPSLKKDYNLIVVSSRKGIGNKLVFPLGPLRESFRKGIGKVNMIIKAINSEIDHHSLLFIKRNFDKIIDAEYLTIIDEGLSENVIVFTGIADPAKLISSIKNKNKRIVKSFLLSDHQEINEKLAKKILEQSEKNNADILTTEKDSVRLLGYKEDSFKNELLLKSNIVNLEVKADVEIIINDIETSLNLSKI
tara:strand:+ start:1528 stop:2523 length:996 start_codon:yes stop_codon:yes gene_type:complete